ncbi:MAG: DUF4139 domain-containing protein [Bacteroidia bacterium]
MKKWLVLPLCFYALTVLSVNKKTIDPKPKKAVVYLQGVELSYTENVYLVKGTNEITVEGVAAGIDENSISAFFKGALVIDTKKGYKYPELPKTHNNSKKYQLILDRIQDSLQEVSYQLMDYSFKKDVLKREKALLLNNRLMRGEYQRDSIELLKASLDLLHARLSSINDQDLAVMRKENLSQKLKAKLNERYTYINNLMSNEIRGRGNQQHKPIYHIIVTVEAESAVSGILNLRYYVASAGWVPRYDVLASSGKEEINLIHRAQVYQNTGVAWDNIALTLSTSNPSMGNTKPLLYPWNLQFGYPNSYPTDY